MPTAPWDLGGGVVPLVWCLSHRLVLCPLFPYLPEGVFVPSGGGVFLR